MKKKELSKLQQYVLCPLASIALTIVIYWQVHYISEIIKHL
ncbi:Uncharacterised protein [Enterobacter cancerogenus]|uniref:Uncharacterized protein n=1 Tax=Enterobacter cancerogenus TaxID=69218 RepID=A0A484XNK1_9ENTR|nr:Uncharacterised protein [Enterobacter cancerogenus]